MKRKQEKGPEIKLQGRNLPRGLDGDVEFAEKRVSELLHHFQEWEVVVLVERAIRNAQSSNEANKKRDQRLRELAKPVREAAKKLFPKKSWQQLTQEEMMDAIDQARVDGSLAVREESIPNSPDQGDFDLEGHEEGGEFDLDGENDDPLPTSQS